MFKARLSFEIKRNVYNYVLVVYNIITATINIIYHEIKNNNVTVLVTAILIDYHYTRSSLNTTNTMDRLYLAQFKASTRLYSIEQFTFECSSILELW